MEEQRPSNLMSGQHVPDVDDDAFDEPAEQSRLEYLQAVNPRHRRPWWQWLLGAIVLAAIIAGGVFWYLQRPPSQEPTTKSATKATAQPSAEPTVDVNTAHYDSANFNLGFDYPEKWTVTDKGDGKITVVSPLTNQKTADGQTKQVRTTITISPKGKNLGAFDKGSGVAVIKSEKIKYTNPTSVQRAETYLSFVHYSTSAGSGLDGIYITGDFGYKPQQYVPKVDIAKLDPLLAVTFDTCADAACTAPVSASLAISNWHSQAFKAPLLAMLTSLSVN
jgi:hypothetical protein